MTNINIFANSNEAVFFAPEDSKIDSMVVRNIESRIGEITLIGYDWFSGDFVACGRGTEVQVRFHVYPDRVELKNFSPWGNFPDYDFESIFIGEEGTGININFDLQLHAEENIEDFFENPDVEYVSWCGGLLEISYSWIEDPCENPNYAARFWLKELRDPNTMKVVKEAYCLGGDGLTAEEQLWAYEDFKAVEWLRYEEELAALSEGWQ